MTGIKRATTDGSFIKHLRKVVENSHVNFLLGAGCSMPAFGTLGNIEELRTELAEQQDITEDQRTLIQVSIDVEFFKKAIYPNVELASESLKDDYEITMSGYHRFCAAAMRLVSRRESTLLPKQVSFFTSNYDICLDSALDRAQVPTNSGFVGRFNRVVSLGDFGNRHYTHSTALGYEAEIPSANLVKIHGCVTWEADGERIYFVTPGERLGEIHRLISRMTPSLPEITTGTTIDSLCEEAKSIGDVQVNDLRELATQLSHLSVVLPNKTKFKSTVLNETYYSQLRRLMNQLENRNSILIVIGFSFADEHLRNLLKRAAKSNPTLQMYIFCYDKGAECAIKKNLGDPSEIPNSNVTTVIAAKCECEHECKCECKAGKIDLPGLASILTKVTGGDDE